MSFSQAWQITKLRPATASPTHLGGKFFIVNGAGVLTCANPEDGSTDWQLRLKGPFSGSPVAAGKYVYCFNEEGLGQIIDTTEKEGKVTHTISLDETILCTPAFSNGAVYVRSDKHLWKLN